MNGMPMLTSIDQTIEFRLLVPLKSRTLEELYRGMDVILRNYNKAGFKINTIHCNGEFKELMDRVKDNLGINLNYMAKHEHVPEAEHNNRTIGERIRSTYHNLPYCKISRIMLKYLAMISTQ